MSRSSKQEEKARSEYQKDLDATRQKRRQYREMLYDAMLERRRLMESMQIQKDEDAILRKRVCSAVFGCAVCYHLGVIGNIDSY